MNHRETSGSRTPALYLVCGLFVALLLAACLSNKRMPVVSGAVMELKRSDDSLSRNEKGYCSTLQLSWFGSGCHLIQLGDLRVLTDPFVSNGKWISVKSDRDRVKATFERITGPQVILVNHSHFDHFMDAHAALAAEGWEKTILYGGKSCRNLMAGWGKPALTDRCKVVCKGGKIIDQEIDGGYHLRVTAYESRHPPHLKCGLTLLEGPVEEERTTEPGPLDYKAGEVFNYLIEMKGPKGPWFRVFYLGAPQDLDDYPNSLPHGVTDIDVALFLAPTGLNVPCYPKRHLECLKPRHIVLDHHNTFFKDDPDAQLTFAGKDFVQFDELSRKLQEAFVKATDYPAFEAVHVPAITVMEEKDKVKDRGRNVLRFVK